jgi:hypothetical protein
MQINRKIITHPGTANRFWTLYIESSILRNSGEAIQFGSAPSLGAGQSWERGRQRADRIAN